MSSDSKPTGPQFLTPGESCILQAVILRIVPRAAEIPSIDLARKVDIILAQVRKEMGRDFKLLLTLLEYGPFLLGGRWKRFTRMIETEQDAYLASWERSSMSFKRMGFQVLRRTVLAAYYGSKESWARIGYRGPWLTRGYPHDFQETTIQIPRHD